jgi:hypothetical protein
MKDPQFPRPEIFGKDVTAEFMRGPLEFLELESGPFKKEPKLEIHVDLTGIADQQEFVSQARRVKAFREEMRLGQARIASIRCTAEQQMWEANVFNSGVAWEKAER